MQRNLVFLARMSIAAVAFTTSGVLRAQQTSSTISPGPVSVRLKLVNTVSATGGGANANILYGTSAPGDSRLFLVQQGLSSPVVSGKVLAINPSVVGTTQTTVLDFGTALPGALDATHNEKGLLGLAFHPNFNKPGMPGYLKFYTYTNELLSYHAAQTGSPSGNPDYIQQDAARYERVTAADVQRVAKKYLARPKVVLTVVPEGKREMMLTSNGGGQ